MRVLDAYLPSIAQRVVYVSVPAAVLAVVAIMAAGSIAAADAAIYMVGLVLIAFTFAALDAIFFLRGFAGTPRAVYAAALVGDLVPLGVGILLLYGLDEFDPQPEVVTITVAAVGVAGLLLVLRILWLDRHGNSVLDRWLHDRPVGSPRRDPKLGTLFGIESMTTVPVRVDGAPMHVGTGSFRYHLRLQQRGVLDQWVGASRGTFLWLELDTKARPKMRYLSARCRSGERGAIVIRPRDQAESRFESIEVDARLKIEHDREASTNDVWRVFDPVVLDTLASRPGVQVEVFDGKLVAYRMGSLQDERQLDELYEAAEVFRAAFERVRGSRSSAADSRH